MKTIVGIDWSEKQHSVHIHNERGGLISQMIIQQNVAGFQQLGRELGGVNPMPSDVLIAIESADNLLVDYLHGQGHTLYILAPNLVASNRGRLGSSGAKDDDRDAQLLADILRTDRGVLIPWQPDGVLVWQMRRLLSRVDDLTQDIVRQHNRLRAHLLRCYPQPLTAFPDLQAHYVLRFLVNYPTPVDLQRLTLPEFSAFCRQQRFYRADEYPLIWRSLKTPAPALDEQLTDTARALTITLAEQLASAQQSKKQTIAQVQTLFQQHPDADIFASLPGAGDLLAPKLLVMFGDHRQRYPLPEYLATIAGTAPVTVASGQSRRVKFRRACNRDYRLTIQQFAQSSVRKSQWAATYFSQALARGQSKSHAYRCLANRWLNIIWTIWQRRQLYDEAYHLQQLSRYRQPQLN